MEQEGKRKRLKLIEYFGDELVIGAQETEQTKKKKRSYLLAPENYLEVVQERDLIIVL